MNRFFTKLTAIFAALLMSVAANAGENTISITDLNIAPQQVLPVEIVMTINEKVSSGSFSCNVYLPEGLSFIKQEYEEDEDEGPEMVYGFFANPTKIKGGKAIVVQSDGSLYIACYGTNFTAKTYPTTDVFATFYVTADKEFKSGEMQIKKIILGLTNADKLPDFNVKVEAVSDAISTVASAADDSAIYSVSGMRVAEPAKGIYIQNGKKFVK